MSYFCQKEHSQPCSGCQGRIKVASLIILHGFVTLRSAFELISPNVLRYKASEARRKLLRMPLACVGVGDQSKGNYRLYLVEKQEDVNYLVFQSLLEKATDKPRDPTSGFSKKELKDIMYLAESESDKQLLKYVTVKASGISNSKAKELYGICDVQKRVDKLHGAVREAMAIRESIEKIASLKDKALLSSFGLQVYDESESDTSESESDEEKSSEEDQTSKLHPSFVPSSSVEYTINSNDSAVVPKPQMVNDNNDAGDYESKTVTTDSYEDPHKLRDLLRSCSFNWFQFVFNLRLKLESLGEDELNRLLNKFSDMMPSLNLDEEEIRAVTQSRNAFFLSDMPTTDDHEESITSDSDSSDVEIWNRGIRDVLGENGRKMIEKRRAAIRRKAVRDSKKKVMERRLLKRRRSKKVSRILSQVPNIGKEIENFVKECGAGADAWRRTGVITFDGNKKVKKKPTFKRVKEYLEDKFQLKICYGTVVQLCVARNKKRKSAARYKGLAKVCQRRARKGFNLKFNPDEHWSAAFYGALDEMQFHDGRKVLNLGRDDQAGFRLDTTATHRQHGSLCVQGSESLTTRTDYATGYPSTLQVTSYNFPETITTAELCAGVVKARTLHEKNAAQHLADIEMLSTKEVLRPVFYDMETDKYKDIEFIRVDGGADENPAHCETRYWWTVHHLKIETAATMVTSRYSGASYRNRVELQNGCLALAHANLFIPSTLHGSCLSAAGKIDETKLKNNLSSAIDVYVNRVDGAPCASTKIHVFRGADSGEYQKENTFVKAYLKGTKTAKETLKKEHPEMYKRIDEIMGLQERHMVKDVPTKYIFYLRCCYKTSCIHPRCKQGPPKNELLWYPGGPPLSFVPLPSQDSDRPFGQDSCQQCKSACSGHYLKPEPLKQAYLNGSYKGLKPPSEILMDMMKKLNYELPGEEKILQLSKEVLLTPQETTMWCDHLRKVHENRVSGTKKRAQKNTAQRTNKEADTQVTGRSNTTAEPKANEQTEDDETDICLECGQDEPLTAMGHNGDEDGGDVTWVCCDGCNNWCHAICAGFSASEISLLDSWLCTSCHGNWDLSN